MSRISVPRGTKNKRYTSGGVAGAVVSSRPGPLSPNIAAMGLLLWWQWLLLLLLVALIVFWVVMRKRGA